MATFNKQKVQVGVSNHSKLDVSSTHVTSSSFMQLAPCYYRHMIPGEHIKGSGNVLSRLAPLQLPSYGRCRVNMRSFFVPFRTVFPNFNEFIVDTIANNYDYSSIVSGSPIIDSKSLRDCILNYATTITGWNVGDPCDFEYGGVGYRLDYEGRRKLKILNSLGYRIMFHDKGTMIFSALPILCLAKVFCDWYANQQYLNGTNYLFIQRMLHYNDPTGQLQLSAGDLDALLSFCYIVCYDGSNDVYLNAWDYPMSPNSGNGSTTFAGSDISMPIGPDSGVVVQDLNGTPYMAQNDATKNYLGSTYLHTFLKSLTDYVKRNQLSGAAAVDRLLTRFGLNIDSAKLDRSIYVSETSVDIDFGAVMQNADTSQPGDPSNLGDYAGAGLGRGQIGFDYKTDEFGLFLVLYSIIPAASLVQGFDRNLLHIDKLSFFNPEFDNLGCAAISKGEVYVSNHGAFAANDSDYSGVFGFAPRYYEYKQSRDFVTGDIVSPLAYSGGDAWHLARLFDDVTFGSISGVQHSYNFTLGSDADIYDRIFQYTGHDIDKFYLVFHFAAESLAPCKSLFDSYDFDDAGAKLSLDSNGAKVN